MGEGFSLDEEILKYITSANIACGFHASDPVLMDRTVQLAGSAGVMIGAHPGFADLSGFGRREMQLSAEEIRTLVMYQVGALEVFCRSYGMKLQHVKPHGALYNMAVKDKTMADAICRGIYAADPELILLGPAGSCMNRAAKEIGLASAGEVFADRAYEEDGSLVSRKKQGAMITDAEEAVRRVLQMVKKGTVTAITGKEIPVQADSICIHGDSPEAVEFARMIRTALIKEGIELLPLNQII